MKTRPASPPGLDAERRVPRFRQRPKRRPVCPSSRLPEAPEHPCPKHAAWPVRAPCDRCGTFYCTQCLHDAGLALDTRRCASCEQKPTAQGIGGWLIFPSVGLIITPLSLAFLIFQGVQALTSNLKAGVATPISIELLMNLALLGFGLYVAVAFFQKRRRAVGLMVGFYAAGLVVLALDTVIASWVGSIVGKDDTDFDPSSMRSVATSIVWIAYFLQSKRVKATFVND